MTKLAMETFHERMQLFGHLLEADPDEFRRRSQEHFRTVVAEDFGRQFAMVSRAAIEDWMIDSGASFHLVHQDNRRAIRNTRPANASLETAAGEVEVRRSAQVQIPSLPRTRSALVLPDSPNCASMGRLVEDENYEVRWRRGDFRLIDPSRTTTTHFSAQI